MIDDQEIIEQTEKFMLDNIPKSRLRNGSDEFYLRHVYNGREYALKLAEIYAADKFIVEVAILLHDAGADAGKTHADQSMRIAEDFLKQFNMEKDVLDRILICIKNHSMGSGAGSIEEQVIQDADGISFISDTYKFYYIKGIEMFNDKNIAKDQALKKIDSMFAKVKTEEGIRIAKEKIEEAKEYIKNM